MIITEQEIRDYCRAQGYDYDKLDLNDDEKKQIRDEAVARKNGKTEFLDGFFAFPRYGWRAAKIEE